MQSKTISLFCAGFILAISAVEGFAQDSEEAYQVQPGDVLQISVWGEPDLQGPALVSPDGTFSFPLVGHVSARRQTAAQLQKLLAEELVKYLSNPVVTVSIEQVNGNKIYIIGQVNQPGAFVMNHDIDVMQALSMAGGTTPFAALNDIIILRRGEFGQIALKFRYSDVARGRNLAQNISLESGDVVVVP